jgi:hypothetical protein
VGLRSGLDVPEEKYLPCRESKHSYLTVQPETWSDWKDAYSKSHDLEVPVTFIVTRKVSGHSWPRLPAELKIFSLPKYPYRLWGLLSLPFSGHRGVNPEHNVAWARS